MSFIDNGADPFGGGSGVPNLYGSLIGSGVSPTTASADTSTNLNTLVTGGGASGGSPFGNIGADLGAGVMGGALLYDLTQGNQPTQQENTLQGAATAAGAQATSLTQQGQGLESYLTQGTLPPGLQAAVDQKVQAAKAATVQQAANTTGNANPTQNSALTQDLNFQSEQGLTIQGQLETQLAQTGQGLISSGVQYAGLQNQDLIALGQAQQAQSTATSAAITAFAGALGKLAFA